MTTAAIKRQLERMLSSRTVGRVTRRRTQGKRLVLAYHGISPDDAEPAGEPALHITASRFSEQLEVLRSLAEVCPLDELDAAGSDAPRVAITFDDAYEGAIAHGVPALVRHGLPATIFVAPGCLDGHSFWWDAIASRRSGLAAPVRSHALDALGGRQQAVRDWARTEHVEWSTSLPAHARATSVASLQWAVTQPGITLGSHSWSHPDLARLAGSDLDAELARPLAWLQARFPGRVVPWIAYPYGRHSREVERAAREAGYQGGLAIEGGWHRRSQVSQFARPRLNVAAGLSAAGLRLRVQGAVLS